MGDCDVLARKNLCGNRKLLTFQTSSLERDVAVQT